jgi:hypothetical protein
MNDLDIFARKYGTDKRTNDPGKPPIYHGYVEIYHELFKNNRNSIKNFLEIGVREGWSHKMWYDYLPNANIYGIDNFADNVYKNINFKKEELENDRIKIFIGDQSDETFLDWNFKDIIFDVIIDDGSHCSWHQQLSFKYLFPRIKVGGYYIIEDLGVCGIREFRQFDDIRSSTTTWLNSMKRNNFFSYYISDGSKYMQDIEYVNIIGELGIIKKK